MRILSIQTGQPQTLTLPDPNAKRRDKNNAESGAAEEGWVSGIFKTPVPGAIHLGKTNLDGDGQGDTKAHGGPDKAVCVYAHDHYRYWQERFGLETLPTGSFGENFTTLGLVETEVCIGDTFAIGDAGMGDSGDGVVVQVSQPRGPCWKLARRWQVGDLVEQVQATGFTGWYFRVLAEGMVVAGDALQLIERPYPHLSLAEANRLIHHDKEDWEAIAVLLACPLLSQSVQNSLRRRINLHAPQAIADRIYGRGDAGENAGR